MSDKDEDLERLKNVSSARQLHDFNDMQPPARANFAHKQGIEMALEIKIRDKRIEVDKLEEQVSKATEGVWVVTETDTDHNSDHADQMEWVASQIEDAHMELSEIIPFSVFPEDGNLLHSFIIENADVSKLHDPDAAADFRSALDALSFQEANELGKSVAQLKDLYTKRDQLIEWDARHKEEHPKLQRKVIAHEAAVKAKLEEAREELNKLVSFRAAETKMVQRLDNVSSARQVAELKRENDSGILDLTERLAQAEATIEKQNVRLAEAEEQQNAYKRQIKAAESRAIETPQQTVQFQQNLREYGKRPKNENFIRGKEWLDSWEKEGTLINSTRELLIKNQHSRRGFALRVGVHMPGTFMARIVKRVDDTTIRVELPQQRAMATIGFQVDKSNKPYAATGFNFNPKWNKDTEHQYEHKGVPRGAVGNQDIPIEKLIEYHEIIAADLDI